LVTQAQLVLRVKLEFKVLLVIQAQQETQVQLVQRVLMAVSHLLLLELILQSALQVELVQLLLTQAVAVAQQTQIKTY
jgi:hypothetical protein